jgi:hypothetical protein
MRKLPAIIFILLAALLVLAACRAGLPITPIRGSGEPVTQTYDFSNFDELELSEAFAAEITASDSYAVAVTVDDNLVDRLLVEQQGSKVKIGLKPLTVVTNAHLAATISLPTLAGLTVSGASTADLSGFQSGDDVQIQASGASQVRGEMDTGALSVTLSGDSLLELAGSGDSLRATASGSSSVNLDEFAVDDADVRASGASEVDVNVTGTLNVTASGASTVHYSGNPTLGAIEKSGASTVSGQ